MKRSWALCLFCAVLALASLAPSAARAHGTDPAGESNARFDEFVPGAVELEGRIIAPCCWTQTIDVHGSPLSSELRLEIRRRLTAGETADAIEQSLVKRYGDKVLAVPPGSRLGGYAIWLGLTMVFAGGFAVWLLRRWQHRSVLQALPVGAAAATALPAGAADAALEARVDAELSRLEADS